MKSVIAIVGVLAVVITLSIQTYAFAVVDNNGYRENIRIRNMGLQGHSADDIPTICNRCTIITGGTTEMD